MLRLFKGNLRLLKLVQFLIISSSLVLPVVIFLRKDPNKDRRVTSQSLRHDVWPVIGTTDDRIQAQLDLRPDDLLQDDHNVKVIFVSSDVMSTDDVRPSPLGSARFSDCPISKCLLTRNETDRGEADVVMFRYSPSNRADRPSSQVWLAVNQESPTFWGISRDMDQTLNWVATYRPDSTIVIPYGRFVHFDNYTGVLPDKPIVNFAAGKTKLVAWFVSDCSTLNGRMFYVEELRKHIQVDIYGGCGQLKCPIWTQPCYDMLAQQYKFYLSFENSNCRNYITEKFFLNGLNSTILPIVMGAPREDYERVSPEHSFIYVEDFDSPASLASYLHYLNTNDTAYNSYFRWRGTGYTTNDSKFYCRLCAMVHLAQQHQRMTHHYNSVWWNNRGDTCHVPSSPDHPWATWKNTSPETLERM